MKTIYLDHNIIHYYVNGFPANVNEADERRALVEIDRRRDVVRIVFSAWNLVEASRESPWDKVFSLAQFMQDREPHWICERRVLQRAELQSFIFSRYFDASSDGFRVNAITPCFSQIIRDLTPGSPVLLGERPEDYILCMFNHDQERIHNVERQTPETLKTLQRARKYGHLTPELRAQNVKEYISLSMPDRAPNGRLLIPAQREEILAYCVEHYEEILHECPCLQTEYILADYRIEDPMRNPEPQDAIDFMHMASALAYCDAVVTHERYLFAQGERYVRNTGRPVVVGRLLSEIVGYFT